MKKMAIIFLVLFLAFTVSWARTYTQQVTITNSTLDQYIHFNYYDHGATLQRVTVILHSVATGGSYAADNDSDSETSDITVHVGASFSLDDSTTAPRLLNGSFANIWHHDTEATKDTTLAVDDGDGDVFDSSSPDGTVLEDINEEDTRQDTIHSMFVDDYVGSGTFHFTLHKAAINRDDHTGGNIDFQGTAVDVGGYVELIYEDSAPPLPIVLSSFNAILTENNLTQINWITASETNLLGYNIYRSTQNDFQTANKITYNIIEGRNTTQTQYYSYIDTHVNPGTTYYYWLESLDYTGYSDIFGSVKVTTEENTQNPPDVNTMQLSEIQSIYPNPFNPSTTITYYLRKDSNVKIQIYNVKGELVKTFDKGYQEGDNYYRVVWNGQSSNTQQVSSGIYFFKLITDDGYSYKKAVLTK